MKRLWIILLVGLLAVAAVAPAAAARAKPAPLTRYYDVTMEFVGDYEGLSTSGGACGAAVLTRLESTDGGKTLYNYAGPGGVPLLELRLSTDLAWYRDFPYYPDPAAVPEGFNPAAYPYDPRLTGNGLSGCHGAGLDVYVEYDTNGVKVLTDDRTPIVQYPGLLRLTPADGEVGFLWHSDYYREWEKANKNRWSATVIEDFSYSSSPSPGGTWTWTDGNGNPAAWNPTVGASGTVTGLLAWTHFSPGVYDDNGNLPRPITFKLTITPVS